MNIDKNVNLFVEGNRKDDGRVPDGRYSSFDYCFNYFQSFRENNKIQDIASSKNLQTSCLQLGFYLASWGMLRGSSFLLKRSMKFYIPLIQYIAEVRSVVWDIDVPKYTEGNIALLIDCRNGIKKALGSENNPSDTLATKVMLGVFANTPAFDTYVKKAFSLCTFNTNSIKKIADFYNRHRTEIDKHTIYTFDFASGRETHRKYTRAKLIDMVGFIEGQNS